MEGAGLLGIQGKGIALEKVIGCMRIAGSDFVGEGEHAFFLEGFQGGGGTGNFFVNGSEESRGVRRVRLQECEHFGLSRGACLEGIDLDFIEWAGGDELGGFAFFEGV